MTHFKIQTTAYNHNQCRETLRDVFDSLQFDEPFMAHIMYDSYLWNLEIMREYARDHHIDEMAYIRGIRKVLLESPKIHAYR